MPWRRKRQPTPVFTPEKIPWTEEPGGLQFKGLQRLGHEWVTKHAFSLTEIPAPLLHSWNWDDPPHWKSGPLWAINNQTAKMGPSAHISVTVSCSWAKMTHATMHLWILWAFPSWIWQSKEPSRQTEGLLGKETMCACAGSPQSPRSWVGCAEAGSLLHHAELSQLRPVQQPACWPLRGTETKAATFCLPSWPWDGLAPNRDPPPLRVNN